MEKPVSLKLASGAVVVATLRTVKLNSGKIVADIVYRNVTVHASGNNEPDAIKSAHQKFNDTWNRR